MSLHEPFQIRWARDSEVHQAIEVWREVSRWLEDASRPLWQPSQFTEEEALSAVKAGELSVGISDGTVAACMLVTKSDPVFWPEFEDGEALYIHKLAVRRSEKGVGWTRRMLDWAQAQAANKGIQSLRLDCDPRPELIKLYEAAGFQKYDPVPVVRNGHRAQRFERSIQMGTV